MTSTTGPPSPPGGSEAGTREEDLRTYYGTPIVREPEWTWEVPWYLFAGGVAGASSFMSLLAARTGRTRLASATRLVAAAGSLVSPVLLISDLGRPGRFLNMLRVFKPTSAMSMGSWLLAAYGPVAAGAAALRILGRLPRLAALLDGGAAVLGLPMTTYTGVLIADTAIPVWHEARRELPALFAASAAAAAGATAVLVVGPAEAAPARRMVIAGAVAETVAEQAMRRRLGDLGAPYESGDAGRFAKVAKGCTVAGAALVAAGGGAASGWRRTSSVAGAALVLAGGVSLRWSVFRAGFESARDPRHVVASQRARDASY